MKLPHFSADRSAILYLWGFSSQHVAARGWTFERTFEVCPVGPQNWNSRRRKDAAARLSKTDHIQRLERKCRTLFFPRKECWNGVNGNESGKIQQMAIVCGGNNCTYCTRLTRPLWNPIFFLDTLYIDTVGFSWTISLPHLEARDRSTDCVSSESFVPHLPPSPSE